MNLKRNDFVGKKICDNIVLLSSATSLFTVEINCKISVKPREKCRLSNSSIEILNYMVLYTIFQNINVILFSQHLINAGMESHYEKVAALGRIFKLGNLYDARNFTLVIGK